MNYVVFKLHFNTAVHFGNGFLNSSNFSFKADTLFSALFIESLKLGLSDQLYQYTNQGDLLFSDAFPFKDQTYYLPKPLLYVEPKESSNTSDLKKVKKINFLPYDQISKFLNSSINLDDVISNQKFYIYDEDTKVAIRNNHKDEPEPYRVGLCTFEKNAGLYIIVGYKQIEHLNLIKKIMDALQYSGLGGKRTSGFGKFKVEIDQNVSKLASLIEKKSDRYMTLSISLPQENELNQVLDGASYLLVKRSGFVQSDTFALEQRRKVNKYLFASGSCFTYKFNGSILNVADDTGSHPVYRYAKPMFIGV